MSTLTKSLILAMATSSCLADWDTEHERVMQFILPHREIVDIYIHDQRQSNVLPVYPRYPVNRPIDWDTDRDEDNDDRMLEDND